MSNMFGPHDHFEEVRSHALGALVSKIADAKKNNKEEVIIWGDGSPIREWLYVEDGADALLKCLNLNEKDYFTIGVNKGITIINLAKIIAKHLSWNGNFVFDKSKPNGVSEKTVVDKFSKNLINWSPSTELEDGIKITVEWYMENNNVEEYKKDFIYDEILYASVIDTLLVPEGLSFYTDDENFIQVGSWNYERQNFRSSLSFEFPRTSHKTNETVLVIKGKILCNLHKETGEFQSFLRYENQMLL